MNYSWFLAHTVLMSQAGCDTTGDFVLILDRKENQGASCRTYEGDLPTREKQHHGGFNAAGIDSPPPMPPIALVQ